MERDSDILSWLNGSQEMSAEQAVSLVEAHPTCVVPIARLLARRPDDLSAELRQRLQAAVMLGCADPAAMADLADLSGSDWANFYPPAPEQAAPSTESTIDKFLDTYGRGTPNDDALLERLIFNPVAPDYFQGLNEPVDPSNPLALPPELDPSKREETQETIIEEIVEPEPAVETPAPAPAAHKPKSASARKAAETHENQAESSEVEPSKPKEEPLLMESLAKIFIKQRRYERAFEIISNLSLKNPEKSAYFADQLRFLRKLILNQRFQQRKAEAAKAQQSLEAAQKE
ncbi:MAG: hypothetical protein LIP03_10855 [Bacteroidales bacterium]|nr:hypothetical protein [Bacteroidales bacterium]